MNTEPKWRVEYDNDEGETGPDEEFSREWWNVTDGEMRFSCDSEMHANWLCGVLNKREKMQASCDSPITYGICANCAHWRKLNDEEREKYPFALRLSEQLARRVDVGFCMSSGERTGPTADGDWCESWKSEN